MKKKIMAVLATIAAVLGFGFATNTAMADYLRRHHRYRDVPCRHIPAERIRHRVLR